MKPAWDSLAKTYEDSSKVIIADVDCTGAGEPLCERFGVQGFPTIKYFNPPDQQGEDYEGGRDLEDLQEFAASSLGPGCSVSSRENCSEEQLAELDDVLKTPEEERSKELEELTAALSTAQSEHEELLKQLQATYEESEQGLEALKKSSAPRIKLLKSTFTSKPAAAQDGKQEL